MNDRQAFRMPLNERALNVSSIIIKKKNIILNPNRVGDEVSITSCHSPPLNYFVNHLEPMNV